ncbi:MarR family transcriptional regulator [Paraburkholderia terrae]|uniref:MarR family winged helix-turn-helix transcriptional regulator n=1 Tax=Paraburkholderia terrae TaxID=311230 RepID=UPI003365A991
MKREQLHEWRHHNVGRLLNYAVQRFEKRVLQLMTAAGYQSVTLSHMSVTRNLDIQGTRATEIARKAGVTKQFVGELVGQLEELGLVERVPDPDDRRARIVRFTPEGQAWLAAFGVAVRQSEQEMKKELGADHFKILGEALQKYGKSE